MFFFLPMPIMAWSNILIIHILAAIIPAVLLLRYVYKHDTIEKEPPMLIWSLVLRGVLAAMCSIVLERIGSWLLNRTVDQSSPYYVIILAFLVVAVIEEGTKLFFLDQRVWNDWNFTHLYDGIVYSVAVSLGFAAFENIRYVLSYGLQVALPRAVTAIPGHLGFSVFMGVFFGRAKLCEAQRDPSGRRFNLAMAYLSAVFLHGFYDACAMIGTTTANVLFVVFIVAMYICVYRLIKKSSFHDRPLYY